MVIRLLLTTENSIHPIFQDYILFSGGEDDLLFYFYFSYNIYFYLILYIKFTIKYLPFHMKNKVKYI